MTEYEEFLSNKTEVFLGVGFEPEDLNPSLKPFQKDIVRWACKKGRAAIFADCGMGKSLMQLAWADQIHRKTGGNVLILAPLAVAQQTQREGDKFGIKASYSRDGKVKGRFVGAELKESYWKQACLNLKNAEGLAEDEFFGILSGNAK